MKLSHIPLLSFIGVLLLVIESQGLGFDHKDPYPCLEVQTKKVHIHILQSYTRKSIPIDAVLFSTKNGLMICADPTEAWVKNAIITLDQQARNPSTNMGTNKNKKKGKKIPTKKPAGKKIQRKQKKKVQPKKKAAPVKSIMNILTTRTPAVNP